MENTKNLIEIQHDALVEVIQWLDSNRHSNTKIREVVDRALNGSRIDDLKEKSNKEIGKENGQWKQL